MTNKDVTWHVRGEVGIEWPRPAEIESLPRVMADDYKKIIESKRTDILHIDVRTN